MLLRCWCCARDCMGWGGMGYELGQAPTVVWLLRWRESVCGLIVWIICVFLVACGDMAGAWDGYLAVDRDGCGRWRVVCGVAC